MTEGSDRPLIGAFLGTLHVEFGCQTYQRGAHRWLGRAVNGATSYWMAITLDDEAPATVAFMKRAQIQLGLDREKFEQVFGVRLD